ncbi:MAG: LCP family protein [Actinobacteria bacterium]|nr:LCP family protein [Actinomycetota bacterium]
MNRARGCFITILSIIILVAFSLLCISLMDSKSGNGDGSILNRLFFSKNLLFLGLDEREDSNEFEGRTDTIMVFHIARWGSKDTLISIPRDTRVELEGRGWNKINAAYVYGGTGMVRQEIYELCGISIDSTMVINFNGFKKIIDMLGGVKIVVSEPLHDPLSGADFEPGEYLMNGEQALSFARCRSTSGADLDRMNRQQYLLNELIKQKMNFSIILKIPRLIHVLNNYTLTDFTFWDFCSAGFVLLFSNKDINRVTIPTRAANIDGISYLLADSEEVRQFLNDYIK